MEHFKVLLPASEIPDGSKITKATGQKEYTLKRELRIFENLRGTECEVIKAKTGVVFLVKDGDINAYPDHTKLLWVVEPKEFYQWLGSYLEETPQ